jgi:hypothetical protein
MPCYIVARDDLLRSEDPHTFSAGYLYLIRTHPAYAELANQSLRETRGESLVVLRA